MFCLKLDVNLLYCNHKSLMFIANLNDNNDLLMVNLLGLVLAGLTPLDQRQQFWLIQNLIPTSDGFYINNRKLVTVATKT